MPFKVLNSLISSYFKEIVTQTLEAELGRLNELNEFYDLSNLLLPNKEGNNIICKSYEELTTKPVKESKEAKEAKGAKGAKSAKSSKSSKDIVLKKIVPVSVGKNVILIFEFIFDKINEFINTHQSLIAGKNNPIKILSEIETEFNIIAILNSIIQCGNDRHNLKNFKEDQFLLFMPRGQIVKINYREIIHMYTSFIIMICNICVKMVISTRKSFSLTDKQLYLQLNILSTLKNCESINNIIKEFTNKNVIKETSDDEKTIVSKGKKTPQNKCVKQAATLNKEDGEEDAKEEDAKEEDAEEEDAEEEDEGEDEEEENEEDEDED